MKTISTVLLKGSEYMYVHLHGVLGLLHLACLSQDDIPLCQYLLEIGYRGSTNPLAMKDGPI